MATRQEWEDAVFKSITKLQEQVLQNMEAINELKKTVETLPCKDEPKHEDLDAKKIAEQTFEIIKKLTMEKNKNGNIHKPNSEQSNGTTIRSVGYILL
jgi:regulator of replication initiation timing